MSQILKSVDFTKAQKSRYLENKIFFLQIKKMGITKPYTHLQPVHFSLYPALRNTLNVIRTKIFQVIGQFPQIRPKNSKLSIFTENWHTRSLRGVDLKAALRFLKFRPQNSFLGKFGSKSQSCPFCLKSSTNDISRILILIPTLVFWISNPKFIFGQVWAKKFKVVCFVWNLACMVSRRYWFLFRN